MTGWTSLPSDWSAAGHAEREGFEPSIRVTPYTAFPMRRPRPARRSLRQQVYRKRASSSCCRATPLGRTLDYVVPVLVRDALPRLWSFSPAPFRPGLLQEPTCHPDWPPREAGNWKPRPARYTPRRRGVRVVDGAALEKRCGDEPPRVRIPPSPPPPFLRQNASQRTAQETGTTAPVRGGQGELSHCRRPANVTKVKGK